MSRRPESRVRPLALLALAVASLASLATSYAPQVTRIDSPVVSGTLTLDADHPMAVQRFTVSLNEVSFGASDRASVEVGRDGPASVRLTVVPVRPDLDAGLASAYPRAFDPTGSEGALVVEAGSPQTFTLNCETTCDRSFRVIAELTAASGSATLTWTASGSLTYEGDVWPSGAAMALQVEPPVSIGGEGRSLSAAISDGKIVLDATRPAAARLVEVRMAAAAVPPRMSDVITTAVLQASFGSSVPGGDVSNSFYGMSFRQVSPTPTVSVPVPGLPQFDPFADCVPGADCVRTYLLTARWLGGKPQTMDWSLHLSQIRLRGDAPPADSIKVSVTRVFDITTDPPQRLHLEGDLQITPGDGSNRESSTSVAVAAVAVDPSATSPVPMDLVPIPGVATFAVSLPTDTTLDRRNTMYRDLWSFYLPYSTSSDLTPMVVAPFGDDHPGPSYPLQFEIKVGANQERLHLAAPITVHWTLDFDVYKYAGLPQLKLVSVPVPVPGSS